MLMKFDLKNNIFKKETRCSLHPSLFWNKSLYAWTCDWRLTFKTINNAKTIFQFQKYSALVTNSKKLQKVVKFLVTSNKQNLGVKFSIDSHFGRLYDYPARCFFDFKKWTKEHCSIYNANWWVKCVTFGVFPEYDQLLVSKVMPPSVLTSCLSMV